MSRQGGSGLSRKIKDTEYLYLSAYLRAKEASLLGRERLERMAAAPDIDEAAKVLAECGYPDLTGASDAALEQALSARRAEVLADMERLCPERAVVEAFRLRYDYHNAKVLVKAEGAAADGGALLSDAGRVDAQKLADAYRSEDWRDVPPKLAAATAEAKSVLARTSNPQLADIVLDKAYYAELLAVTQTLSDGYYTGYARLCIDAANLRSAVRCVRAGLDEGVLRTAVVPGGNVPAENVARRAYAEGVTAVFGGELVEAAALGQEAVEGAGLSAFERACDDALTRHLGAAKRVPFGPAVAVAYIVSLEGEITAARMVLLGKRGGVAPEMLRERLRESYV